MNDDYDKKYKKGNHYSEFSKDEFKSTQLPIKDLCEAIKADNYGLKFPDSPDNSIGRLNEMLECPDLIDKLIDKKVDPNRPLDIKALISITSEIREEKKPFIELNYDEQINIRRLNRLLLEETYPRETPKSSKYFIPPGLINSVNIFEDHYKVAKGEPILIIGQTGVGKSLFLHIFEKLYRQEHEDEKKYPIIKANCAHFGGDPNLVRSELFGHMEGAFTDAIYDKSGLVEMADGGVLILEEIGDLPLETQAMLLTFIETGEYFRVGDDRGERIKRTRKLGKKTNQGENQSQQFTGTTGSFYREDEGEIDGLVEKEKENKNKEHHLGPRKATVQIVGLTNREGKLRDDFNHRFFPFYVPPICKRRSDILYYLNAIFPDIIDSLRPYEILILLTYHWPGNVREIERVGRLLLRNREHLQRMTQSKSSIVNDHDFISKRESVRLYFLNESYPHKLIEGYQIIKMNDILINNGIDVDLIESILNSYRLGLKENHDHDINFSSYGFIIGKDVSERYGLRFTYYIDHFEDAYKGIEVFCDLFYQNAMANVNLLDLTDKQRDFSFGNPFNKNIQYPDGEKDRYDKLVKSMFEFLSGIKLKDFDVISKDRKKRREFFSMLGKLYPGNHFLASLGFAEPTEEEEIKDSDICSFKVHDLLKLYYQKILDRAQGNQEKGARFAGLPKSTFIDKLNKYGIKAGRRRKTGLKIS